MSHAAHTSEGNGIFGGCETWGAWELVLEKALEEVGVGVGVLDVVGFVEVVLLRCCRRSARLPRPFSCLDLI